MATGFSQSLPGEHDMVYDHQCTACLESNLNNEAYFYCRNCLKKLCSKCKSYHDGMYRAHDVLGESDLLQWVPVKISCTLSLCEQHPGKTIKTFCCAHEKLFCSTCITADHGPCDAVKPIHDVAKGILKKPEFKSIVEDAVKVQSELKQLSERLGNDIGTLEYRCKKILKDINDLRGDINQHLDQLEQDAKDEIETIKKNN